MSHTTGTILYDNAANAVEEVQATAVAVQAAIDKEEKDKQLLQQMNPQQRRAYDTYQQQQQQQHLQQQQQQQHFSNAVNINPNDANNNNTNSASSQQQTQFQQPPGKFFHHHQQKDPTQVLEIERKRSQIVIARRNLLRDLRAKIIDPLSRAAGSSPSSSASLLSKVMDNPLLHVHKSVHALLKQDSQLATELDNIEHPLPVPVLDDDGSTSSAAHTSAGKRLQSLAPVAWCVRVSYAEAARTELIRNKSRLAHVTVPTSSAPASAANSPRTETPRSGGGVGGGGVPVHADHQPGGENTSENDKDKQQKTQQQQQPESAKTTTDDNSHDNHDVSSSARSPAHTERSVATTTASERRRRLTVDEMLKRLPMWKQMCEVGPLPKTVKAYIQEELASLSLS